MKRLTTIALIFGFFSCGFNENKTEIPPETLNIACAANMQFAMDSIAVLFEAEHGIHCDITSGSSGMLTSQIENGAPYDIFISANMRYPESIHEHGMGEEPQIYAQGRLIFVTDKSKNYKTLDEALADKNLERIGIADHQTAPYGMAADQFLNNTGRMTEIRDQLVIGESIGQINSYITTGSVDAVFTSYSFKVKNEMDYLFFEVDQSYFSPINQGMMLLNHGKENRPDATGKFISFFSTAECKAVLEYFGYLAE